MICLRISSSARTFSLALSFILFPALFTFSALIFCCCCFLFRLKLKSFCVPIKKKLPFCISDANSGDSNSTRQLCCPTAGATTTSTAWGTYVSWRNLCNPRFSFTACPNFVALALFFSFFCFLVLPLYLRFVVAVVVASQV